MNSSYYNISITLRYTNYNFIMGVVAVPELRAMLGVVKCPLREAFLYIVYMPVGMFHSVRCSERRGGRFSDLSITLSTC